MRRCLQFLLALTLILGCQKTRVLYNNNPNAPDYLHNRPVGASANELLSASQYNSLQIEVQYMTGYPPDANALNHLQSMLSGVLNKSTGISIFTKEIPASANSTLSIDNVAQIEYNNRTAFTSGDQIAVYILFTNGYYTENNVLGAAYKNTSIVIFGKDIYSNSGGIGQTSRTTLEATVMEHEFGHLLGLVDLGSPMQTNHDDAAHPHHCTNSNCLMYYQADTHDMLGNLFGGSVPSLDANCLADLHANGGK